MPPALSSTPDYSSTPPAPAAGSGSSNKVSALLALLGGGAAIAGSLLNWGAGKVESAAGAEKAVFDVAGFDSSGIWAAVGGGVLLVMAVLFFAGIKKQTWWAAVAFLTGAIVVGAVVFSAIDIRDLSGRVANELAATGQVVDGDTVSVNWDLGLWIAGAGGVLGVLAAPFVSRS